MLTLLLLLLLGQLPTELPTYLFESLFLHIYDTLSTIHHTRYTPDDNINKRFYFLTIMTIICLSFSLFNVFLLGAAVEVGSLPLLTATSDGD